MGGVVVSTKDFSETLPMGLYEDAIGERNVNYYVDKFEDFDQQGPGLKISWNWAAFFGGGAWALYRKMYWWFVAWWVVTTVVTVFAKIPDVRTHQVLTVAVGVFWLGFSIFANSLYHGKIKARIAAAQKLSMDASRVSKRLQARSGVLMWVPIVFAGIPVIGIVAAVALPAYQDYAKRQVLSAQQTEGANLPAVKKNPFEETQELANEPQRAGVKPFSYDDGKYEEGVAASKRGDYTNAAKIFHALAANGHSEAQSHLGGFYSAGLGVSSDYVESVKWYRMAAMQGSAVGQSQLGISYSMGQGVLQDYVEAVKWYRMAATQGDALAQNQLGISYLMGQGVPQDYVRAHMWLNLSAASGKANTMQNRDTVAASMTLQQIAQAQQMARDCQQRNFQGCD